MPFPVKLCVIHGSAREDCFCDIVAGWGRTELKSRSLPLVSVVDPLDGLDTADRNATLAVADAFVVVTSEDNHSFPAPLKAIITRPRASGRPSPSPSSPTAACPAGFEPSSSFAGFSPSCIPLASAIRSASLSPVP